MEYFLDIYDITDWKDFTYLLSKLYNNDNTVNLLFSALLKSKQDIIYSSNIISYYKLLTNKNNNKFSNDDIINEINKLINLYKNNKNEPLLYEKLKL